MPASACSAACDRILCSALPSSVLRSCRLVIISLTAFPPVRLKQHCLTAGMENIVKRYTSMLNVQQLKVLQVRLGILSLQTCVKLCSWSLFVSCILGIECICWLEWWVQWKGHYCANFLPVHFLCKDQFTWLAKECMMQHYCHMSVHN